MSKQLLTGWIGDGLTSETAFRPAVADQLDHYEDKTGLPGGQGVFVIECTPKRNADLSAAVELYDDTNADERPDDTEAATLRTQLQARGFRAAQLDMVDAKEEVVTQERVPEVRDPDTDEVITPEVPEVRETLHATRRERAERIIDQLTNRVRPQRESVNATDRQR